MLFGGRTLNWKFCELSLKNNPVSSSARKVTLKSTRHLSAHEYLIPAILQYDALILKDPGLLPNERARGGRGQL